MIFHVWIMPPFEHSHQVGVGVDDTRVWHT